MRPNHSTIGPFDVTLAMDYFVRTYHLYLFSADKTKHIDYSLVMVEPCIMYVSYSSATYNSITE